MLNIQTLIDDAKCFETVRTLRWPEEVSCVQCGSAAVTKQGRNTTQPERQKHRCRDCGRWFDDLFRNTITLQIAFTVAKKAETDCETIDSVGPTRGRDRLPKASGQPGDDRQDQTGDSAEAC
jgi:hypothetical protein